MFDRREPFEFIFGGGMDYIKNWVDGHGNLNSLLLNSHQWGISGNDKSDLDAADVVDHIISRHYSKGYAFIKQGSRYRLFYLWAGNSGNYEERESKRKIMQEKSDWFFEILKVVEPKLVYVSVKKGIGGDITYVKKVSEIPESINRFLKYNENVDVNQNVFIRVKANSSRINLFYVKKSEWNRIRNVLEELSIEYKTINVASK